MRPTVSKPCVHERVQQALSSLKVKPMDAQTLMTIYALPERTAKRLIWETDCKRQQAVAMAREGYGYEDITVRTGIPESETQMIVTKHRRRT